MLPVLLKLANISSAVHYVHFHVTTAIHYEGDRAAARFLRLMEVNSMVVI